MRQFINISKRVYKITFKIILSNLSAYSMRHSVRTRGTCRDKFFARLSLSIRPRNLAANSADANHDRSLSLLTARSAPSPSFVRSLSTRHLACYRRNTVCTLKATLSIPRSAR